MNSTNEICSIREWAPLTEIIEKIPTRLQKGIFPIDLNITCIDALPEFLALGSDVGIIFWYNRINGEVQKLHAETATCITCVRIVSTVEYMVAAGSSVGQVHVFQIQKELPKDINLVAPFTKTKPIERYTVRDLHRSGVTCCEWSKNGMKLYSGDQQGIVVLTELDYQLHLTNSTEILNEVYRIIQLSVHQSYLLVSTLYRSIVCHRNELTRKWRTSQVGKKDRRVLAVCGGTFVKRDTKQPQMICGRPGLRFWIADIEGNVEKTLIFKDAVARRPTWEIPILNPKSNRMQTSFPTSPATNFQSILIFGSNNDFLVVTHDEASLYILDLEGLRVKAVANAFRNIIDCCVCGKEIFILEGSRSLLRLASVPELPNKTAKIIFNPMIPPPVPAMGISIFESTVECEAQDIAIVTAEECFELSSVTEIDLKIPIELAVESPRAEKNRRMEVFRKISEMDFDQSILHHSGTASNRTKKISLETIKKQKSSDKEAITSGIVEIGQTIRIDTTLVKNTDKPITLPK